MKLKTAEYGKLEPALARASKAARLNGYDMAVVVLENRYIVEPLYIALRLF